MLKKLSLGPIVALVIAVGAVVLVRYGLRTAQAFAAPQTAATGDQGMMPATENGFSIEVLVDGRPVSEYAARGRRYVEALQDAEYELRIHNATSSRVAVALSVDGLNTIDARHSRAWDAHKWVIEPYGTISVGGWQMSSENARRFYFTTERDSYAAKLGQAVILPVTPGPPRPRDKDEPQKRSQKSAPLSSSGGESSASVRAARDAPKADNRVYPPPDDESAATGIGRTVRNDVQWIKMDLDSRPIAEVSIRYEYRAALVRLGILPRDYPRPDVLDRRERAKGFDPRYCPVP